MLTAAERKVAAVLLDRAQEEFSRHGCNDFDLVREAGLTPKESLQLRKEIRVWARDAGAPEVESDRHMTMDWLVMSFLAGKILEKREKVEFSELEKRIRDVNHRIAGTFESDPMIGPRARHKGNGNIYDITGTSFLKSTLEIVISYTPGTQPAHGVCFSCPVEEFFERFEPLSTRS